MCLLVVPHQIDGFKNFKISFVFVPRLAFYRAQIFVMAIQVGYSMDCAYWSLAKNVVCTSWR